jgi:hypothetical protein
MGDNNNVPWWDNPANYDLVGDQFPDVSTKVERVDNLSNIHQPVVQPIQQPIQQPSFKKPRFTKPLSPDKQRSRDKYLPGISNRRGDDMMQIGIGAKHAGERIRFSMICFPLSFHEEYDKFKNFEYSNKIIAPNNIIQQLSQYDNIKSEYIFQINKKKNRVTIGEYYKYNPSLPLSNAIYIPNQIFESLGIENGDRVAFDFINVNIPKGTRVELQPDTDKINEIEDIQDYLHKHLQENYTCLISGDIIKIPFFADHINMIINTLEPADIVSITNTDLIVDFKPSVESLYRKKTPSPDITKIDSNVHKLNFANNEDPDSFDPNDLFKFKRPNRNLDDTDNTKNDVVSFQGKGHQLGNISEPTSNKTKQCDQSELTPEDIRALRLKKFYDPEAIMRKQNEKTLITKKKKYLLKKTIKPDFNLSNQDDDQQYLLTRTISQLNKKCYITPSEKEFDIDDMDDFDDIPT